MTSAETDNLIQLFLEAPEDSGNRLVWVYSKLIKEAPKNLENYVLRGSAYLKFRDFEHAFLDFLGVAVQDPLNSEASYGMGLCFYEKKDWKNAVEHFTRAIQADPTLYQAFKMRGLSYIHMVFFRYEAIDDLSEAINLQPSDSDSYYGRSVAYEVAGEQEKARLDQVKGLQLRRAEIEAGKLEVADSSQSLGWTLRLLPSGRRAA